MTSAIVETDFYVVDGGSRTLHHLAIYSPEPIDAGDSHCKIRLSPLLANEKTIIGSDSQQAKHLALEFVRMLLLGKKLQDTNGVSIHVSDILGH